MSLLETGKTCRICKKRFCCADCRQRHENNKHPQRELNCPLCCAQKLPLQVFENKEFVCHVVINHLPLYCCLCGTIFTNSKDLENFGACKWWQAKVNRHSLVSESKFVPGTPSSSHIHSEIKVNEQSSADINFVSLTSPPELFRKTSTPMHGPLQGQKGGPFEFKTPNFPNFSLKTPKTGSAVSTKDHLSRTNQSTTSKDSTGDTKFVSFSSCESSHNEKTPFRSCSSSRSSMEEKYPRMNSGRKLGVMEEQDERDNGEVEADVLPGRSDTDNRTRFDSDDMDMTGIQESAHLSQRVTATTTGHYSDMELTGTRTRNGSDDMELTGARTRIGSDDMELTGTRTRIGSDDMELTGTQGFTGPEVDSSSQPPRPRALPRNIRLVTRSMIGTDDMELTRAVGDDLPDSPGLEVLEQKPAKRVRFSDQHMDRSEPQNTVGFNATESEEFFEAQDTISVSRRSLPSVCDDGAANNSADNSNMRIYRENKENDEKENGNPSRTVTSGSSRVVMMVVVENNGPLASSDLTPLIDSGLKRLEENATASIYSSATSVSSQSTSTSCNKRSITSVDYVRLSNVESISGTGLASSSRTREPKPSTEGTGSGGGGILSVVAQAVKFALRNLSGASTSRAVTRHPSVPRDRTASGSVSDTTHSSSLRSTSSSLMDRPAKRPRDIADSPLSSSGSYGSSTSLDALISRSDVTSPVAKRHRGWYKIKSREPIARMQKSSITSPRGISSETQIFSQGSLSVGDTILPIPSRAHQYTQTD